MKFIFPRNYNLQSKFLGIIDYYSLFFNLLWDCFIFCFLSIFIPSISVRLFFFIILCLPFLFFSILGINNENILNVIIYILKYLLKPKVYLYYKN